MAIINRSIFLFLIYTPFFCYIIIPKKMVLTPCSDITKEVNFKIAQKLSLIKYYSKTYWDSKEIFNYLKSDIPELDFIRLNYKHGLGVISIKIEKPIVKIGKYILTQQNNLVPISDYSLEHLENLPEIIIEDSTDASKIAKDFNIEVIDMLKEYKIIWQDNINILLIPFKNSLNLIKTDITNLNLYKVKQAEKIKYQKCKVIDIRFENMLIVRSSDINQYKNRVRELGGSDEKN